MPQNDASLRPIERRVIALRQKGVPFEVLALKFKRSSAHLERIVKYANLKLQR